MISNLLNYILNEFSESENIALVEADKSITYADLFDSAKKVGTYLINIGVKKQDRIVILARRSIDSVIAIIGSLYSNAIYVPIDYTLPIERINTIINNCRPVVVISFEKQLSSTQEKYVAIDYIKWGEILSNNINQPISIDSLTCNEDPAYIMYTSGSTGAPKGVTMSHNAAIFFCNWAINQFQISSTDKICALSSFSFDLSVFDIYVGLRAGATIYLVSNFLKSMLKKLAKYILDKEITVIYTVPSLLMLLEARCKTYLKNANSLNLILFAGESYPSHKLRRLIDNLPETVKLFNLYGPTETNVCSYFKIPRNTTLPDPIPIGKPLPGISFTTKIIDDNRILCIESPGSMINYWGNIDFNKDIWLFLDNQKKRKAFISYDDVTLLPDGNWRFNGRTDDIIKISGYRISTKEIEATIMRVSYIENTVVICINSENHNSYLAAFVTLNDKNIEAAGKSDILYEIITHCKRLLPYYMIPKNIVVIKEMPNTTSGKIDRKKLMLSYKNNLD